jgi:hypothetical protein
MSRADSFPPRSWRLTRAHSRLMERPDRTSSAVTTATQEVKINEEKQKSASSTSTPVK